MKRKIFRLLWAAVFLFLFAAIYARMEDILILDSGSKRAESFYKIERDSLDVVFMGSSHAYYGIHPMDLWREYGVASYTMAHRIRVLEYRII